MTWIRDNILKVVVLLIVFIIAIVLVSIFSGKKGPKEEKANGYTELENKLQSAAIKYARDNETILPQDRDEQTTIKLEKLIKGNYINNIKAIENSSVSCNGYVVIERLSTDEEDYKFYPHLNCGKYYSTSTISEKIKSQEKIVTENDGLYQINDNLVFKGEYPRNYIKLDNGLYRILSINSDNELKLISAQRTKNRYLWDNRYNADINKNYGINNFMKSRLKDSLEYLYYNDSDESGEIFYSDKERKYFIYHDFCIGKRSNNDLDLYSNADCSVVYNTRMGLIELGEYFQASIDPNCNRAGKYDCNNYNYLYGYDYNTFVTSVANKDDSHTFYLISDGNTSLEEAYKSNILYPVVYISKENIYVSGDGTKDNPYVIR